MRLHHVALVNSSEEKSDWFYKDVLGLEKKPARRVPAEQIKKIFKINEEARLINYIGDNGLVFEIFVTRVTEEVPISHCCLMADNRDALLDRCEKMNVTIHRIARDDGTFLVFIKDGDNNLFEIK